MNKPRNTHVIVSVEIRDSEYTWVSHYRNISVVGDSNIEPHNFTEKAAHEHVRNLIKTIKPFLIIEEAEDE